MKYIVTTINKSIIDVFLSSPVVKEIIDDLWICVDNEDLYKKMKEMKKYEKYHLVNMAKVVKDKLKEYKCSEEFDHFKTFHKIWLYDWLLDKGITEFHATDDDVYLFKKIPFTKTTFIKDILCSKPCKKYVEKPFWSKFEYMFNKPVICIGNMSLTLNKSEVKVWKSVLKEFVKVINKNPYTKEKRKVYDFFLDTFFVNCVFNKEKVRLDYSNKDNKFFLVSLNLKTYFSDKFNLERIKKKNIGIHFSGIDKEKIYKRWKEVI